MRKPVQKTGRTSSCKVRRLAFVSILVAIFALGATAAVSLRAKRNQTSASPAPTAPDNQSRGNLSYRVNAAIPLDPQTGQVRPLTPEEAQKLAAGLKQLVNQSTDGLQPVRHMDGSVSLDLHGRFQNVAVAKRDEDGKLIESCIDNPAAAAAFFEIDPQLLGVKRSATSARTNNATQKGGDR